MRIIAGEPTKFTKADRETFVRLVRLGDEVATGALKQNVENAEALVFLKEEGLIRGIAALKLPQESYRERIGKKTKFNLGDTEFPYELGYIFIVEEARNQGWSRRLVKKAIECALGSAIFATIRTDNDPMLRSLRSLGFEAAGEPYQGRNMKHLQVYVSKANPTVKTRD